jgi:hypothetical protein
MSIKKSISRVKQMEKSNAIFLKRLASQSVERIRRGEGVLTLMIDER